MKSRKVPYPSWSDARESVRWLEERAVSAVGGGRSRGRGGSGAVAVGGETVPNVILSGALARPARVSAELLAGVARIAGCDCSSARLHGDATWVVRVAPMTVLATAKTCLVRASGGRGLNRREPVSTHAPERLTNNSSAAGGRAWSVRDG